MTSVCFIFEQTKLLQFHKNEVSAITINQSSVFGVNQRHLTVKGRSIILIKKQEYNIDDLQLLFWT